MSRNIKNMSVIVFMILIGFTYISISTGSTWIVVFDLNDARLITVGTYSGDLTDISDEDEYYSLSNNKGQIISIEMTLDPNVDFDLRLYDPEYSFDASTSNSPFFNLQKTVYNEDQYVSIEITIILLVYLIFLSIVYLFFSKWHSIKIKSSRGELNE